MPTTTRRRASLAGSLPDDELSIAESHDSPKVTKGRKSLSAGIDVDVMEQRRRALEWKEKFLQSQKPSEEAEELEETKATKAPVKRSTRRTAKAVKEEKEDSEEVLKPRTRTRRTAVKEEPSPVEDDSQAEDKENDDNSINSNPNSSLAEEGEETATVTKPAVNKTPRKRLR